MRFILKLLLTLVAIVAFLGMGAAGALWAYGEYGVPLVHEQLQAMEDQVEADLEAQHPGSDITIDFVDVFYKTEGSTLYVAFEVHAIAKVAGIEVENKTEYVSIDVNSAIMGDPQYVTYEESAWSAVEGEYTLSPTIIFDGAEAKKTATTYFIIAAIVFVGSIVVNVVFLRKKRARA